MQATDGFWDKLDMLVGHYPIEIDRPKGTAHPHYPDFIMPLDYGFLQGSTAADGGGIDCWCGSLDRTRVDGVMVTLDLGKMDAEIKIMVGCTPEEMISAWETFRTENQGAVLIRRD